MKISVLRIMRHLRYFIITALGLALWMSSETAFSAVVVRFDRDDPITQGFGAKPSATAIDLDGDGADDSQTKRNFTHPGENPWGAGSYFTLFGGAIGQCLNSTSVTFGNYSLTSTNGFDIRYQTTGTGQSGRLHLAVVFQSSEQNGSFDLGAGSTSFMRISGDNNGSLGRFENLGEVRWLVRNGTDYYVSQSTITNTTSGRLLDASELASERWARYDPSAGFAFNLNLQFDTPTSQLTRLNAFGLVAYDATFKAVRRWLRFAEFEVDAIPTPAGGGGDLPGLVVTFYRSDVTQGLGSKPAARTADLDADGQTDDSETSRSFSQPGGSPWGAGTAFTLQGGVIGQCLNQTSKVFDEYGLSTSSGFNLRYQTDGTDQSGRLHLALLFEANAQGLRFDLSPESTSYMRISGDNNGDLARLDNLGEVRWLVRNGTDYYVSNSTITNTLYGRTLHAYELATETWARYNPADAFQFNLALNFNTPTSSLTNLNAFGVIAYKPTFSAVRHALRFSEFEVAIRDPAAAEIMNAISASSYLGGTGTSDAVRGTVIQSDGTVVLAANLSDAAPGGKTPIVLPGATAQSSGAIVRLSPDGKTVLSVTRLADRVLDLARDDSGNLYVAAWTRGLLKLNPQASAVLWSKTYDGRGAARVDAGPSGISAVLTYTSSVDPDQADPGSGIVYVYQANGTELSNFVGHRNTLDVAVHEASQTIVHVGWRQTSAWDGTRTYPVQIAYIRGRGFDGTIKYTGYDWPTDRNDPNFLNRYTNNMADTRGYRCSIGKDGQLYVAFECAGGNHIFRYDPFDLSRAVTIVGGDKYHEFYNTRSEHKTFFARYNPATGAYLLGQQLTARKDDGAGNAVRPRAIEAGQDGTLYLCGTSAAHLPLTWDPFPQAQYRGGAFLLVMSPDFTRRLLCIRQLKGTALAVALRSSGYDSTAIAWGGQITGDSYFYRKNPIQNDPSSFSEGMYMVLQF